MRFPATPALISAILAVAAPALAQESNQAPPPASRDLANLVVPSTDDLPGMEAAHAVRVLVSVDKTGFFVDAGRPRGFEYELMQQYQKFLNKDRGKGKIRISVVYIPRPFESLLTDLVEGRGDVVAAGMTITPQRLETVNFTIPYVENVRELIITHGPATKLKSLEDLSGRQLYVLKGSSFVEHLNELNRRFEKEGRPPMKIVESDPYLSVEDILELVNAGIHPITVADSQVASLWSKVLPDIHVHQDLAIRSPGGLGWAVRKNNPRLLASLNEFLKGNRQGSEIGNVLFARYYKDTEWIKNPLSKAEQDRLAKYRALFQEYSTKHDFDWLLIAALAYQESGLDPKRRSNQGAVGIMQVRPATGNDKNIAVPDVYKLENNIHAGVKYLAFLRDRYFSDSGMSPENRIYFSLAAYNAGPANVTRLQKKAHESGLDPNLWFEHVELVARREIGVETVRYVSNIYKYYLAYSSIREITEQRAQELNKVPK